MLDFNQVCICCCGLLLLPLSVWLLSRCFLPQSKHAHIRLIGNLKLSICVSAWLSSSPSTSRSLPSMINWRPGRRVTPSLVSRQLGWTPPSPTKHSACFWIAAGTPHPHTHSENMQAKTPRPWDPTPFKLHVKKSISLFPPTPSGSFSTRLNRQNSISFKKNWLG